MIYALQRATNELRDDIKRYGITVEAEKHRIIYKGAITILTPYTPKTECKKAIRVYIKRAKEAEIAKQDENQERLF